MTRADCASVSVHPSKLAERAWLTMGMPAAAASRSRAGPAGLLQWITSGRTSLMTRTASSADAAFSSVYGQFVQATCAPASRKRLARSPSTPIRAYWSNPSNAIAFDQAAQAFLRTGIPRPVGDIEQFQTGAARPPLNSGRKVRTGVSSHFSAASSRTPGQAIETATGSIRIVACQNRYVRTLDRLWVACGRIEGNRSNASGRLRVLPQARELSERVSWIGRRAFVGEAADRGERPAHRRSRSPCGRQADHWV